MGSVLRMPRGVKRCAADPAAIAKAAFATIPVLRSGMRMPHRARDECWSVLLMGAVKVRVRE
jgi:hypothetical protein